MTPEGRGRLESPTRRRGVRRDGLGAVSLYNTIRGCSAREGIETDFRGVAGMSFTRISALALGAVVMSFAFAEAGSGGLEGSGPGKDDKPLAALNAWLGRLRDVPKEG